MAFLIDQLNNSGLFAQSAYSAGIATCDSDGNIITATYLSSVDLTPYQTTAGMTAYATTGDVENKLDASAFNIPASSNWNSTYDTVQSNSANWNSEPIESYNLSAGKYINITKDDVNSAIGIETTGLNVTNWNSNYDTVNTNSGVWGGQTLPISAGPGIKLDIINGTLVASNDETVLWSGLNYINSAGFVSITLSEATTNFNTVKIAFARGGNFAGDEVFEFVPNDSKTYLASLNCYDNNFTNMYCYFNSFTLSGSTFAELNGKCGYYQVINGTSPGASVNKTWCWLHPYKIVGINRINNG